MKHKKCKNCREIFEPQRPLQQVCSVFCGFEYQKTLALKKEKKDWKKKKSEIKEGLLTRSDYLKLAQKVFNEYIRFRDREKPCISCLQPLKHKYDAGHFYSVGGYAALRFNEFNVHAQCVHCNQHKHGNLNEYAENLPNRIGIENFIELKNKRHEVVKHSIEELKEIILCYKEKLKNLKNGLG